MSPLLLFGAFFVIAAPSCTRQMTADELRAKYDREDQMTEEDRLDGDTVVLAPVIVHSDSVRAVSISEIFSEIPEGQKIGAHKVGLFREKRLEYRWKRNVFITNRLLVDITEYTDISELGFTILSHFAMLEEAYVTLESYGYPTVGDIEAFKSGRELKQARFHLHASIQDAEFNTYGGNEVDRGKASVTTLWKLVDGSDDRTVWMQTYTAEAESHELGAHPLALAFGATLRKALSAEGLVSKLYLDSASLENRKIRELTACAPLAEPMALPRDLEAVMATSLRLQVGKSSGSGVLISSDGYALTAAHVVGGWDEVGAVLYSGDSLSAQVVRVDSENDVALLKLPEGFYGCALLSRDTSLSVGSELWVIGAPLMEELSFSVSRGIVSGIRTLEGKKYIQTDASVNFGNSGGPLIRSDGSVVGIVSLKANPLFTEGIAFGVPINVALEKLSVHMQYSE